MTHGDADDEWQSTPTSTPQLMHPKPPRITPPLLCTLQTQAECRPTASDTLPEGLPDTSGRSMSQDADVASPSGRCEPGSHPIPCCSPEVQRFQFRHKHSPYAKALGQAGLCVSAESQLEGLPSAVPSTTPILPHLSSRRRRAWCMQCSEDQATIRPFPDLNFDTEASGEAVPSDSSPAAMHLRYCYKQKLCAS